MEEFNFEVFTGVKGKFTPKVSLSRPGMLSFSNGAQHRYHLAEYKTARLLYDKKKQTIAVNLCREEGDGRFNLRHRPDNKGSYIACKSFVSAYELEAFFGKRFTPTEMDHPVYGKLLLLDLTSPN